MITPSGGDDGPQLSQALTTGDLIAKGNYILQTPIQGAGDRLQFNGTGRGVVLSLMAPIPAFQIVGPGTGITLRGFTAMAAVAGASLGQCWGQQRADHADVSGYLSDLTLEDFAAYGLDSAFDVRFCMGGVTVQDYKIAGGGNGFYFRDCGEGKLLPGRVENMRGYLAMIEGPDASDTSDHSAEDFVVRGVTGNLGGGQGLIFKNQGFSDISGCDITGCHAGPAVFLTGRIAQLTIRGNVLGGVNAGQAMQQHGLVMDINPTACSFKHVTIVDNNVDSSCIGLVVGGEQITVARNKLTANSNVDILTIGLTNSDVDKNHCDSTSFLYGSAQANIFEGWGGCKNNSFDGNWVQQPIVPAAGSGSSFTNTRKIA